MTNQTDTRSQIMDAFTDQLAATGYPGISLVEVARTVGIRKPSIYHHFPGGKEDLYAAVAERHIEDTSARMRAALDSDGPLTHRLIALAKATADDNGTVSFEQRIYDTLGQVSETTKNRISDLYVNRLLEPVVDLFAGAVEDGEVNGDPQFLMNAFLHLTRASDLDSRPDNAERIVSLFLDGARPR